MNKPIHLRQELLIQITIQEDLNLEEIICFSLIIVSHFQTIAPFERKIQPDELWLYRNPRTDSYVTEHMLWPLVIGGPLLMFFIHFLITRNKIDFLQSHLALTLSLGLNAVLTDVLKLTVGESKDKLI